MSSSGWQQALLYLEQMQARQRKLQRRSLRTGRSSGNLRKVRENEIFGGHICRFLEDTSADFWRTHLQIFANICRFLEETSAMKWRKHLQKMQLFLLETNFSSLSGGGKPVESKRARRVQQKNQRWLRYGSEVDFVWKKTAKSNVWSGHCPVSYFTSQKEIDSSLNQG